MWTKRLVSIVLLLVARVILAAEPAPVTAFIDVNVLPMDSDRELLRQTVIVQNGRIEIIGPMASTQVPSDAQRVEGNGTRYLLPGLADMHTHLASPEDAALYLAGGVTTVLQMGGEGKIEPVSLLKGLLKDA